MAFFCEHGRVAAFEKMDRRWSGQAARHQRPAWALAPLLGALAVADGRKTQGQLFDQNCAARKLCNRPLEERDPKLHEVPPELEGKVPKGHLKPLGHPDFLDSWAGAIDVLEELDPKTFWTEYWPKKPFLLKGWAKRSPAFKNWQDDKYLAEKYGHFKMKCEPRNEDRLTDYCNQVKFGQKIKCSKNTIPYKETHMNLSKFIEQYKNPEFDKYVITQMPDEMGAEWVLPTFHSCAKRDADDPGPEGGGRWMTQMYENNFWFAWNGGNNFSSSVIHYDMNHQIMCQFAGTKEWFMWDMSTEGDKIPMWSNYYEKGKHRAQGSDDSPVDGERVDLLRWPKFREAKWKNTTLEPGDCLYTPALLLHYVRSYGRSIAAMTMWQKEERFDPKCNGEAVGEPMPLSKYDFMWSFPEEDRSLLGWNMVKMGYPNWKMAMLRPLAQKARSSKDKLLSKKAFTSYVLALAKREGLTKVKGRIEKAWKEVDPDGDGKAEAWRLFRSPSLRHLFKDVGVMMEGGRGYQEEDEEVVQPIGALAEGQEL